VNKARYRNIFNQSKLGSILLMLLAIQIFAIGYAAVKENTLIDSEGDRGSNQDVRESCLQDARQTFKEGNPKGSTLMRTISYVDTRSISGGGFDGNLTYYYDNYFHVYKSDGNGYQIPAYIGQNVWAFVTTTYEIYYAQYNFNSDSWDIKCLDLNDYSINTIHSINPTTYGGFGSKTVYTDRIWIDINARGYILVYFEMSVNSEIQGFVLCFKDDGTNYQCFENLLLKDIKWGYDNYFYGYNDTGLTQGSFYFPGISFSGHPNEKGLSLIYPTYSSQGITCLDVKTPILSPSELYFYVENFGLMHGECEDGSVVFEKMFSDQDIPEMSTVIVGTNWVYYKSSYSIYRTWIFEFKEPHIEWVAYVPYDTVIGVSAYDLSIYIGGKSWAIYEYCAWDDEPFDPYWMSLTELSANTANYGARYISWEASSNRDSKNPICWTVEYSTDASFNGSWIAIVGANTSFFMSAISTNISIHNGTVVYFRVRGMKNIYYYNKSILITLFGLYSNYTANSSILTIIDEQQTQNNWNLSNTISGGQFSMVMIIVAIIAITFRVKRELKLRFTL